MELDPEDQKLGLEEFRVQVVNLDASELVLDEMWRNSGRFFDSLDEFLWFYQFSVNVSDF